MYENAGDEQTRTFGNRSKKYKKGAPIPGSKDFSDSRLIPSWVEHGKKTTQEQQYKLDCGNIAVDPS
jgi:hypothetical protein